MYTDRDQMTGLLMAGAIVSGVVIIGTQWLVGVFAPNLSYDDLAACATGQNPELRETAGVAEVSVTFKDGAVADATCAAHGDK